LKIIHIVLVIFLSFIFSKNSLASNNADNKIEKPLLGKIICIDPGHGNFKNNYQEKIAPTSDTKKSAFVSGANGLKYSESEINLMISKKLEEKLISYGATVITTRSDENALLGNVQRAQLANENNADLAIRLHADGSDNKSVRGMSMLIPGDKYIKDIELISNSKRLGELVLKNTVSETGARNRGIVVRDDMTGFNWSEVPVILFEMGFMSNAEDEKLLAADDYQNKIVGGIIAGILEYYEIK